MYLNILASNERSSIRTIFFLKGNPKALELKKDYVKYNVKLYRVFEKKKVKDYF